MAAWPDDLLIPQELLEEWAKLPVNIWNSQGYCIPRNMLPDLYLWDLQGQHPYHYGVYRLKGL